MTERCIGPGAHTHYWDESADVIGAQLDALVLAALSKARAAKIV